MKNKKEIYTFNMNDEVAVKLTEHGENILNRFYENLTYERPQINSKKVFKTELWNLFRIFGPELWHGCEIPFKNNIIQIRKRD